MRYPVLYGSGYGRNTLSMSALKVGGVTAILVNISEQTLIYWVLVSVRMEHGLANQILSKARVSFFQVVVKSLLLWFHYLLYIWTEANLGIPIQPSTIPPEYSVDMHFGNNCLHYVLLLLLLFITVSLNVTSPLHLTLLACSMHAVCPDQRLDYKPSGTKILILISHV